MILTFSTSHILNDNFRLSMYNIFLYELLIHPAGSVIHLPGEVVVHYARLYFEVHIRAAVVVPRHAYDWQVSQEDRVGVSLAKIRKDRLILRDAGVYGDQRVDKKQKWQRMECWVIIH